jgi:hypothetical protein
MCELKGGAREIERNLDERVALAVINFQDRGHVATAITIIGCTKYSDHLLFLSRTKKTKKKRYIKIFKPRNTKQVSQK